MEAPALRRIRPPGVIVCATAACAAVSPGSITPSVAQACLPPHDQPIPPRVPHRVATLAVRSTIPWPRRRPDALGDRAFQTP